MLPSKGYSVLLILYQVFTIVPAEVLNVTADNIHQLFESYELVILNFYVTSCKFSIQFEPVINSVDLHIRVRYPENNRVALGRVDCDIEKTLAKQYWITKYPTLAVVQHGIIKWNEYHGPRDVRSIMEFLDTHMKDPVRELKSKDELGSLFIPNVLVVGYFNSKSDEEYSVYREAVRFLGPFGEFYIGVGDIARDLYPDGRSRIIFNGRNGHKVEYTGDMKNVDKVRRWIFYQCEPMVQEITFANAALLTQAKLPLMILFHKKMDHRSVKIFRESVEGEPSTSSNYHMAANFVTATYEMFSEVVQHMGKTENDLPLIVIDSYQHMYEFPNFEDIRIPGKIQSFIEDLYSGKLHYQFHQHSSMEVSSGMNRAATQIPESKFKNLQPSKHRYTLVKDEL